MRLGTKVSDARYGTLKFSSSTGSEILSIDDNNNVEYPKKSMYQMAKNKYTLWNDQKSCVFVSVSMATR